MMLGCYRLYLVDLRFCGFVPFGVSLLFLANLAF